MEKNMYLTIHEASPNLFYLLTKNEPQPYLPRSRRYNNLILQYDTFLDEVVYTDTSRTMNYRFPEIALNKDIVEGFNLYFEDDSLHFQIFQATRMYKE